MQKFGFLITRLICDTEADNNKETDQKVRTFRLIYTLLVYTGLSALNSVKSGFLVTRFLAIVFMCYTLFVRQNMRLDAMKITASKGLFLLNQIFIVTGAIGGIASYHGDEIYQLLLVLGVLGGIGGIVSLFIDCTGKQWEALSCLFVWHSFLGICLYLVYENSRKVTHQYGVLEVVIYAAYVAVYITLWIAEAVFILREKTVDFHRNLFH